MGNATMICKVCGKEYPYCNTLRNEGLFRWQDVACCPEHGNEYFAAVLAERARHDKSNDGETVQKIDVPAATSETNDEDDLYDYVDDDDVFADDEEDEDLNDYWYEEEFEQ